MQIDLDILVGPHGAYPESKLVATRYPTGNLALVGVDKDGEMTFCATVNMDPYGSRTLDASEVWLKGWAENEGLPQALEQSGAVRLSGERMQAGFAEAQPAVLDELVLERLRQQEMRQQQPRSR